MMLLWGGRQLRRLPKHDGSESLANNWWAFDTVSNIQIH